ncbi:MAG: hypothetical protein J6J43_04585 [Oscillospiraceae bacterium]|nr:hypothetical protein [Oscillospiraceae bacterium]
MNKEQLFEALSDVGDDLLVMAERKHFASPWRKWGQTAAVLAVVVCLTALALPYFPAGCGAAPKSAETAVMTEECAAEDVEYEECVVEECEEEAPTESIADKTETQETAEGGIPETTQSSDGLEQDLKEEPAQAKTKIICRGTYFYLDPASEDMGVPPLGEELGVVTGSEDLSLRGCRVYTAPYSTWFTNFAVNGESVTQDIYVQTPSGYRTGSTANEKIVSRYSFEDVRQAVMKQNYDWLAETFVLPIERLGGVDFTAPSELSAEELDTMFWASTNMNTGISVANYWYDGNGYYVVPVADIRWRLDRFLTEYDYTPEELEHYSPQREAMIYPQSTVHDDRVEITVHTAVVAQEENVLYMLISLPEQKGLTKEYFIRFDDDSWRYQTIHALALDGT